MRTIKVLGPGCAKCRKLLANAETAVRELGIDCEVEKIEDINAIVSYDVMMTPALVVDGEVKSSGKALTVNEIKMMLG
ncbi:MAG: thioredoxin family protein [bacterium]